MLLKENALVVRLLDHAKDSIGRSLGIATTIQGFTDTDLQITG